MAYEFKKLSAVEAVETPADTANVLIEEDGVIKRTPKSEVGGTGVTSWNDLTDKPFGEEEGKIVAIPETAGTVVANLTRIKYDASLLDWTRDHVYFIKWDGVEYECTCSENGDACMEYTFTLPDGNTINFVDNGAIFTNNASTTGGLVVGDTHTYEVYTYGTVVKKLDEKYLPGAYVLDNTDGNSYPIDAELVSLLYDKWHNAPAEMPKVFIKGKASSSYFLAPVVNFSNSTNGDKDDVHKYMKLEYVRGGSFLQVTVCASETAAQNAENYDMA